MKGSTDKSGVRSMRHVTLECFDAHIANNMKLLARSRNMSLYELQNQIVRSFLIDKMSDKITYEPSFTGEKKRYNAFVDDQVFKMIQDRGEEDQRSNSEIVLAAIVSFARDHGLDTL
ncbi:hypothetical protein [Pectobacterium versatile]|uniref:hypothetical protein n=1 Tax=Pectobacterium versatile TaxID=2488639 RepID=UPI001F3D0E55|nr:hypothetical protein [Pectobacterium versatile]